SSLFVSTAHAVSLLFTLFSVIVLFFVHATASTEIYTLSLHDALPISRDPDHRPGGSSGGSLLDGARRMGVGDELARARAARDPRSEEHTSELQSHLNLVCRLLLEKKKNINHDTAVIYIKNLHLLTADC